MYNSFSLDHIINKLDKTLRILFPPAIRNNIRPSPAQNLPNPSLNPTESKHVAGLMRVNHAGEVCAQALYQGQAFATKDLDIKGQMQQAAREEEDHLAWCEQRLSELNSHPSLLNCVWYTGSLCIGALAGLAGDKYSLGFLAETERQVSLHLQKHLSLLPPQDRKSREIIEHMYADEMQHEQNAIQSGAEELPPIIKKIMQFVSSIMTKSSYYI